MSLFTYKKQAHSTEDTEIFCNLEKLASLMLTAIADEQLMRKLSKVSKECTANTDRCCYTIPVVAIDVVTLTILTWVCFLLQVYQTYYYCIHVQSTSHTTSHDLSSYESFKFKKPTQFQKLFNFSSQDTTNSNLILF